MADWELMFLVDRVSDDLEDYLCEALDAVVGRHGEDTIVSVTAAAPSAYEGAKHMISQLESVGAHVRRLYEDLVSRSMIADRTGVTPQAVGLWIRGERHGADFPRPYTHAGGGLWLWSEVDRWLGGLGLSDGMRHPDHVDYIDVNHWLGHREVESAVEEEVTNAVIARARERVNGSDDHVSVADVLAARDADRH